MNAIPEMGNKGGYIKIIGENEGGVYMLRFRDHELRYGFTIERFNHNLGFIESEDYKLSRTEKLIKIFTTDTSIIFIVQNFSRKNPGIDFYTMGYSIKSVSKPKRIYSSKNIEKYGDDILIDYDIERKYFGFWISEIENQNQKITFISFDNSGKSITQFSKIITEDPFNVSFKQSILATPQKAAMIYSLERPKKRNSDPASFEVFIIALDSTGISNSASLSNQYYFVSNAEMNFNQYKNYFTVCALYSDKSSSGAQGFFSFNFNTVSEIPENFDKKPFDKKIISRIIGAKEAENGESLEDIFIRKLIPKSDGGFFIVAENYKITIQPEIFVVNGVQQSQYKSIFNYNDILLLSVNANGELEWRHSIYKRQTGGTNNTIYFGLCIMSTKKCVSIVYNDNSYQIANNRIVCVNVFNNGNIEQRILLNSDNEFKAIVPYQCKQVGYNRMITPLYTERNYALLKIVN